MAGTCTLYLRVTTAWLSYIAFRHRSIEPRRLGAHGVRATFDSIPGVSDLLVPSEGVAPSTFAL